MHTTNADSADSSIHTSIQTNDQFPALYASTQRFSIGVPRNLTVVDHGKRVLFLRSPDGRNPALCLWQLNVEDQSEEMVVSPETAFSSAGRASDRNLPAAERARRERARESASGIVAYSLDAEATKACFALAGSLYVVDLNDRTVTAPNVEGPIFDPRLSPDGKHVAYVSASSAAENALRVVDLTAADPTEADRIVAFVADPLVSYGKADFIAAEEMQRSRGYWWSPDSTELLVTRVDDNPVNQWWVHDPAHPGREPTSIRYPAAGTANPQVEVYLVGLDGKHTAVNWDDDHYFEYLANVIWTKDHSPLIVRQTRDQRHVSIAELDLETMKLTEVRSIHEDTWVELIPSSPTRCSAGILTVEDLVPLHQPGVRDAHPGRRALLLNGTPLTDDEINVRSIVGVVAQNSSNDGDDTHALVTAWSEPTEIHLYLVPLGGPRPANLVALTTNPGVHGAAMATDGSTGDSGPVIAVTASRPGADGIEVAIRALDDTQALGPPLAFVEDVSIRPPIKAMPVFCKLGADRLESAVFLPADFGTNYSEDEPLPVLLDPYGGPHAQRVLKTQTPHLVSQWFANQGFVVLVTDGRGTPGRGPRWERQVWGDLAEPVLEDQLVALDAAAAKFGFLDLDRVAIRGWSFGGYLAALAVLRQPNRFHAAIAGAPVTDWALYDTHYTERYLGHPQEFPQHYSATDLTAEAAKLTRPLMLIHGLVDDNVVAAHTLRLSSALLGAGAPHQVLPLSGVTHMTPQQSVAENLLRIQSQFLHDSLNINSDTKPQTAASGKTY